MPPIVRQRGALALALLAGLSPALAQPREEESPRSALRAFLDAAHEGRQREAARFLVRDPAAVTPAEERLARDLRDVFDGLVTLRLEAVSDHPEGTTDDRLHPSFEEVAQLDVAGAQESIRMQRVTGGRWIFAPGTLARVPVWHALLPDGTLRRLLPDALLRTGFLGLIWWQLVALPLFLGACWLIGRALEFLLRFLLRRLARRTATHLDDEIVTRLRGPLTLLGGTATAWMLLPVLVLGPGGNATALALLSSSLLAALFWAALRFIDVADEAARTSTFVKQRPETLAVLPLARKTAKIVLLAIAVVSVLQKLGYPAASLVAGLGIGGLAFALAAQKTIEHLFGGVVLGLDQPFRPGDLVKVDDLLGIVDSVGLRSTRIRTLARTMVTIPNGRLADMRIETFATRDRIRLGVILGLVFSTGAGQMRAVVQELEAYLNAHPRRFKDEPARVFFVNLGSHSLDVDVSVWLDTADWNEFQALRQEILLECMAIVTRNGSAFAFPTRTIVGGG